MIRGIAAVCALLMCASVAQAQIYRWIDENGRVRYTDTPPPASAKGVERKRYSGGGEAAMPLSMQIAIRDHPVVLYTAPDCDRFCADGRAHLDKRSVPYREVVVRSKEQLDQLQRLAGTTQVPVLTVGKATMSGFESAAWSAALDQAGYPSAALGYKPRAAALPAVKLYTSSQCTQLCTSARNLLNVRKVPFQEVEVENDESFAELQKVSGGRSVPVLVVGSTVQNGYAANIYETLLDAAGFPKAAKQ